MAADEAAATLAAEATAEAARVAAEAAAAEAEALAALRAEAARLAESVRADEEARVAAEAAAAEEVARAEAGRIAEEALASETARRAEQARLAETQRDDDERLQVEREAAGLAAESLRAEASRLVAGASQDAERVAAVARVLDMPVDRIIDDEADEDVLDEPFAVPSATDEVSDPAFAPPEFRAAPEGTAEIVPNDLETATDYGRDPDSASEAVGSPEVLVQRSSLTYTPPTDAHAAWLAAVGLIAHEGRRVGGAAGARLIVASANLRYRQVGDAAGARGLLDEVSVPLRDLRWWEERAGVLEALGDAEGFAAASAEIAASRTGEGAVDAWIRSAATALPDVVVARLLQAHAAEGDDTRILHGLMATLAGVDAARLADILGRIAATLPPEAAGVLYVEQGRVLADQLDRVEDAAGAWQLALAANPADNEAFAGLESWYRGNGDDAALASLYLSEGERLAATSANADAALWFSRAARLFRGPLHDDTGAAQAWQRALAATPGALELRHEYSVFLADTGQYAALADSLRAELETTEESARSFLEYRLGRLYEDRLGQTDEALACYRRAAADRAAAPAAEAVLRMLQERKEWAELVAFLEERLGRLDDPSLSVTVLYRMGEICEGPMGAQEQSRKHYERILDVAPGYLPALEGLERVYTRLRAWADLAALYEQRALLADDPQQIAVHRQRAGSVYEVRLDDLDRARDQYRLALDACPDFLPSLDAYTRSLELIEDWAGLGRALKNAAAATRDANETVSLYYRAGRVLADRTDDAAGAMLCLRRSLEFSPGFLPAVLLLKDLAIRQGDWAEFARVERGQADSGDDIERRHWRLLAAAEAGLRASDTDPGLTAAEVLREDPTHAAAGDLAERLALSASNVPVLVDLYLKRAALAGDPTVRARLGVRVAEIAVESGDAESLRRGLGEVLAAGEASDRPLLTLARGALRVGLPDDALHALSEADQTRDFASARLRNEQLGDATGAEQVLSERLAEGDAAAAAYLLRHTADPGLRARAHLYFASGLEGPAATGHALLAAPLLAAAGDSEGAIAAWKRAFDASPRPGGAFDALRSAALAATDADALGALYAALDEGAREGLGDDLLTLGDHAGAVAFFRERLAAAPDDLAWSVRLEQALAANGDWTGVFDVLTARMQHASAALRDETGARCRWVLSDKLTDSDNAWDFYKRLHAEAPGDVDVLEALARISAARGELELAAGFLEQLTAAAPSPEDAGRYQRRVADAMRTSGRPEEARAAYLRALDFVPQDEEALDGLLLLAESAQDWSAMIQVLGRKAALAELHDQILLLSTIAQIWEERIGDKAVAADSWRKVLDVAHEDQAALRRLLHLSEEEQDWAGFVEYGQRLLPYAEASERTSLMRRIGVVLTEHMHRDDDAIRFLDSATTGPNADVTAAEVLERVYTSRGEWDRVVDTLLRRSRAETEAPKKAAALSRAAQVRLETLQDRNGAAALYAELLAVDPLNAEALPFRSEYLYEAGQLAQAVELFERQEALENARDMGDFDVQIEVSLYYYRFADALRRLGRTLDAVRQYERALELNPTHLPTLEAIGPMYMENREWAKAERVWRQILQLTGGHGNNEQLARVYANLGIVEYRLGQVDKARRRFVKALDLKPTDVFALKGYSTVLYAMNDWNNLLTVYNNIIFHTHDPADVIDAYLGKGWVLDTRLNLPDKAAQHYEKSLAFDPRQPVALLRLAEIALRREDWPEAATYADRGLQIPELKAPLRAALFLVRTIAYQAVGDGHAAGEAMHAALIADPTLVVAFENIPISNIDQIHGHLRERIQSGRL